MQNDRRKTDGRLSKRMQVETFSRVSAYTKVRKSPSRLVKC